MADRPIEGTSGQGRQEPYQFRPFTQTPGGEIIRNFKTGFEQIIRTHGIKEPIPKNLTPEQRYAWQSVLILQKAIATVEKDLLPAIDQGKKISKKDLPGLYLKATGVADSLKVFNNPVRAVCENFPIEDILKSAPKNQSIEQQKAWIKDTIQKEITKRWAALEGIPNKEKQLQEFLDVVNQAINQATSFEQLDELLAGKKYQNEKKETFRAWGALDPKTYYAKAFVVCDPITQQLGELVLAQTQALNTLDNPQRKAFISFFNLENATLEVPLPISLIFTNPYKSANQANGTLTLAEGETMNVIDYALTEIQRRLSPFNRGLYEYWKSTALEEYVHSQVEDLVPIRQSIDELITQAQKTVDANAEDPILALNEKLAALAKAKQDLVATREIVQSRGENFKLKKIKSLIPDCAEQHRELNLPEFISDSSGDYPIQIRARLDRKISESNEHINQAENIIAQRERDLLAERNKLIKLKDARIIESYQQKAQGVLKTLDDPNALAATPINFSQRIHDINPADLANAEAGITTLDGELKLEHERLAAAMKTVAQIETAIVELREQHKISGAEGVASLGELHAKALQQIKETEQKLLRRQDELVIVAKQLETKRQQCASAKELAHLLKQNNPADWPKTLAQFQKTAAQLTEKIAEDQKRLAQIKTYLPDLQVRQITANGFLEGNRKQASALEEEMIKKRRDVEERKRQRDGEQRDADSTQIRMQELELKLKLPDGTTNRLLADQTQPNLSTEKLRKEKIKLETAQGLLRVKMAEKEFDTETFRTLQTDGTIDLIYLKSSSARVEWDTFYDGYYGMKGFFSSIVNPEPMPNLLQRRQRLLDAVALRIEELEIKIQNTESYNALRDQVQSKEFVVATMTQTIGDSETNLAELERRLAKHKKEITELEPEAAQLNDEMAGLTAERDALTIRLAENEPSRIKLTAEISKLEKKIAMNAALEKLETKLRQDEEEIVKTVLNPMSGQIAEIVLDGLELQMQEFEKFKKQMNDDSQTYDETSKPLFEQRLKAIEQMTARNRKLAENVMKFSRIEEAVSYTARDMAIQRALLQKEGLAATNKAPNFMAKFGDFDVQLEALSKEVLPPEFIERIKQFQGNVALHKIDAEAHQRDVQAAINLDDWLVGKAELSRLIITHKEQAEQFNAKLQREQHYPFAMIQPTKDEFKALQNLHAELQENIATLESTGSFAQFYLAIERNTSVAAELEKLQAQLDTTSTILRQTNERLLVLDTYREARHVIVSGKGHEGTEGYVPGYIARANQYIKEREARFPIKDKIISTDRAERQAYVENDLVNALNNFEKYGDAEALKRVIADGIRRFPGKVFIATVLQPLLDEVNTAELAVKAQAPAEQIVAARDEVLAPPPVLLVADSSEVLRPAPGLAAQDKPEVLGLPPIISPIEGALSTMAPVVEAPAPKQSWWRRALSAVGNFFTETIPNGLNALFGNKSKVEVEPPSSILNKNPIFTQPDPMSDPDRLYMSPDEFKSTPTAALRRPNRSAQQPAAPSVEASAEDQLKAAKDRQQANDAAPAPSPFDHKD